MIQQKRNFMKKRIVISSSIVVAIFIVGYVMTFPKWLFPNLYPTYIDTIESNWGVLLPVPNSTKPLYDTRGGFHGDGDAITELQYKNELDIRSIRNLSNAWVSGKELNIKKLPKRVQALLNGYIDKNARYFYLNESAFDYVIFKLQGHKLTIFESYI